MSVGGRPVVAVRPFAVYDALSPVPLSIGNRYIAAPNRIRDLRVRAGLTQDVLADLVGVSRSSLARWEAGELAPRRYNARLLAKRLGVSVADLGLSTGGPPIA